MWKCILALNFIIPVQSFDSNKHVSRRCHGSGRRRQRGQPEAALQAQEAGLPRACYASCHHCQAEVEEAEAEKATAGPPCCACCAAASNITGATTTWQHFVYCATVALLHH